MIRIGATIGHVWHVFFNDIRHLCVFQANEKRPKNRLSSMNSDSYALAVAPACAYSISAIPIWVIRRTNTDSGTRLRKKRDGES